MTSGKQNVKVVSLFAGCGGLDFGFRKAGYDIIWANEWMKDAAVTYERNFGHKPVVDDIWNVIDQVPAADVVIGGPPCQAFSLVGKRMENDPRAKLVHAYRAVVERLAPKAFVMENVPGLMASKVDGKRLVDVLIEQFKGMGYSVTLNKLLATDYFVPQKRRRVVMVGIRGQGKDFKMLSPEVFGKIIGIPSSCLPITAKDALGDLPNVAGKGDFAPRTCNAQNLSAYARIMREGSRGGVTHHAMPTMSKLDREFVKYIPPGGNYMDIPDSISTTRIKKFKATGGRTTTYGRLSPDEPAYTINTYFNRPNVGANYHYSEERLISVREAMRLQSFPDSFVPFSTSQRTLHMQIGNAVPPFLGWAIAESLKGIL